MGRNMLSNVQILVCVRELSSPFKKEFKEIQGLKEYEH